MSLRAVRRRCPQCRRMWLREERGIGVSQIKCGWCSYKEPEQLTEIFKKKRTMNNCPRK